jgi:hypothetical protein
MSLTWGHHSDLDSANAHMRHRRQRRANRAWLRDRFGWLRWPGGEMLP